MSDARLGIAGIDSRNANEAITAGRLCRLRGAACVKGELVVLDIANLDADTSATVGDTDLGTADGTRDSGPFATVMTFEDGTNATYTTEPASSAHATTPQGVIYGVALQAGADNDLIRVEFGETPFGVIVDALISQTTIIGAALVPDGATIAAGALSEQSIGKIVGIALEGGSASVSVPIKVLFNGVSGFGFRQT